MVRKRSRRFMVARSCSAARRDQLLDVRVEFCGCRRDRLIGSARDDLPDPSGLIIRRGAVDGPRIARRGLGRVDKTIDARIGN
jgi:hypothetical protein